MTKRGPNTLNGKAISSRNALKHGVFSASPFVPGMEREEDWEAHRAQVVESLAPVGYMETLLAERIALSSWRLQRVAQYERNTIINLRDSLDRPADSSDIIRRGSVLHSSREKVEQKIAFIEDQLSAVKTIDELPDDAVMDPDEAVWLVSALAEVLDVRVAQSDLLDITGKPTFEEVEEWTAGLTRAVLDWLADEVGWRSIPPTSPLSKRLVAQLEEAQSQRDMIDRGRERRARERMLPDGETLQKITRYEAHLTRQFYQALHELEAMQERRLGGVAPLARLDISGIPQA